MGRRLLEAGAALSSAGAPAPPTARPRIRLGDAILGAALLLLLALSLVGAWITTSPTGTGLLGGAGASLWTGFGILPGALIVAGMAWFALTRLAGIRVVTPIPDLAVWVAFAIVEMAFFTLHWVVDSGVNGTAFTATPGWAVYAAMGAALLVGVGAALCHRSPGCAPPARAGALTLDLTTLLRRLPVGDGLILAALLLLLGFSFIPAWVRATVTICLGPAAGGCVPVGATSYAPLWGGYGIVPGLLLLLAALWFAVSRIVALRPSASLEAPLWIGFCAGEVALFLLHWVIDGGTGGGLPVTTTPGWAAFCSIAFAGLLGLGAGVNLRRARRARRCA